MSLCLRRTGRLPISPTGLTVIYGENGAGKSGYSRVLKKACRARDQAEPILPDARKPPSKPATPKAAFDVMVNGVAVTMHWQGGQAAPSELSEIAIFDSHCARAYLDNQGDFAYAPYAGGRWPASLRRRAGCRLRVDGPPRQRVRPLPPG